MPLRRSACPPLLHLALAVLVAAQARGAGLQTPSPSSPSSAPPPATKTVVDAGHPAATSLLDSRLLVTWYGSPRSARMGVLGTARGDQRAAALRQQADAYRAVSDRVIQPAYHLIAVMAQTHAGRDGTFRRREPAGTIAAVLAEARSHGFHLILDIQQGRAPLGPELEYLRPFLMEPDVHLGLDPEWAMTDTQQPGRHIGRLGSHDVNTTLDFLEGLITEHRLPRKVLVLYQFTLGMLPDKAQVRTSEVVEVALVMDGHGSQSLKRATYRAVMRQGQLAYAGFKVFFNRDGTIFSPEEILALDPAPVVISYQ